MSSLKKDLAEIITSMEEAYHINVRGVEILLAPFIKEYKDSRDDVYQRVLDYYTNEICKAIEEKRENSFSNPNQICLKLRELSRLNGGKIKC